MTFHNHVVCDRCHVSEESKSAFLAEPGKEPWIEMHLNGKAVHLCPPCYAQFLLWLADCLNYSRPYNTRITTEGWDRKMSPSCDRWNER